MMKRTVGLLLVATVAVSGLVVGEWSSAVAQSATCPLAALKKASKPVEITMWHSMNRENETTLQAITEEFNSSQSDVRVELVNQVSYDDTFTKYKSGLGSGDLPDIVQLQETEQQQMIDSRSITPSGACAKADKYSFRDFLPRVVSYFTVEGQMYAMPFNNSGPVLYYNKKAFVAAGLDPEKPPTTLAEVRAAAEKLQTSGAVKSAPFGLKVEPGFVEHWLGLSGRLSVNNSNGRTSRATASVLAGPTGRQVFTWLSGMVEDGLAVTNPSDGANAFDNLIGIGNGNHAMTIDTSASLGTISVLLASGAYPDVDLGVARMPGLTAKPKGGVLVSGGALYIVNKSAPEKQAAAWEFMKFLDEPETQVKWAVGTGYVPIRKSAADSSAMKDFWAKNPGYEVAFRQLLAGPVNPATAGSVIGNYVGVRDAVRDGENSMFLEGTAPAAALRTAASNATDEIVDYNELIGAG